MYTAICIKIAIFIATIVFLISSLGVGFNYVLHKKDYKFKLERHKSVRSSLNNEQNNYNDQNDDDDVDDDNIYKKIDWHDRTAIAIDNLKFGFGEKGKSSYLPLNGCLNTTIKFTDFGYNAQLSDLISLYRSLPDMRHPLCNETLYFNYLPSVSILMPFYNEHWSVLLRSIHSILERTPSKLIYEIILIDDGSDEIFLGQQLDDYIINNLPKNIKLLRLNEHKGLIAYLSGVKEAKGEVLLFLDTHIEPNYNWLPPLLDLISTNKKRLVFPIIDKIKPDTFEYKTGCKTSRTGFDWSFTNHPLRLLPADIRKPSQPFKTPIMPNSIFAINRLWFLELGGFDPLINSWIAEHFELSFKVWMCGGEILQVPCSRIGRIQRGQIDNDDDDSNDINSINMYYKRIAVVWMDEYAEKIYDIDRDTFDSINPGDLTELIELRTNLKCASFDWYMKTIANYSYVPPNKDNFYYAYGAIRNMANNDLCLDTYNCDGKTEELRLYPCTYIDDDINGEGNQNWEMTKYKDLKVRNQYGCFDICLDAIDHINNGKINFYPCHGQLGNQLWFYDYKNQFIKHAISGYCIEGNIYTYTVLTNPCDVTNNNMKWQIGYFNETALNNEYNIK